jgi:hypothetical protein
MAAASSISFWYSASSFSSTWAVGGARAGAATNSYVTVSNLVGQGKHRMATNEGWVADELASKPEEGLLEVVVGLGGDVVVLEVLLAVEGDGLGLDLALLHVDLVSAEDDGDVLTDTDEVAWESGQHECFEEIGGEMVVGRGIGCILTVPVGNVLVGDAGRDIEHDDAALAVDVVSIAKTTELLLAGSVPDVELDLTEVLQDGQLASQGRVCKKGRGELTVEKPRGWTSTPRVAMYFFSNSPVRWRLTKVVYRYRRSIMRCGGGRRRRHQWRCRPSRP